MEALAYIAKHSVQSQKTKSSGSPCAAQWHYEYDEESVIGVKLSSNCIC